MMARIPCPDRRSPGTISRMPPATLGLALGVLTLAAEPLEDGSRFEALARAQGGPVWIRPREAPPPEVPSVAAAPVLDVGGARRVVDRHRDSLWPCHPHSNPPHVYVLHLAVRSNGRVGNLRLGPPSRVSGGLRRCVRKAILRWRFPSFTGERNDGRTVEIVNLSVPIAFGPIPRR